MGQALDSDHQGAMARYACTKFPGTETLASAMAIHDGHLGQCVPNHGLNARPLSQRVE